MSISSFNKHFITSQVAKNLYVVLHKGKMFVSLVAGGYWLLLSEIGCKEGCAKNPSLRLFWLITKAIGYP